MRAAVLGLVVLAACGRLDFDAPNARGSSDASDGDSGHPDTAPAGGPGADAQPSQIAFVQGSDNGVGAAQELSTSLTQPVTAGDTLVVVIDWDGGSSGFSAVDDTLGNTFSVAVGPHGNASSQCMILYATIATSGPDTVTGHLISPSADFFDLRLSEFSGLAPTNVFDTGGANSDDLTTTDGMTTPPLVTSAPDELLFAIGESWQGSSQYGTGDTGLSLFAGDLIEMLLAPTPGTYVLTGTVQGNIWTMEGAAFHGR